MIQSDAQLIIWSFFPPSHSFSSLSEPPWILHTPTCVPAASVLLEPSFLCAFWVSERTNQLLLLLLFQSTSSPVNPSRLLSLATFWAALQSHFDASFPCGWEIVWGQERDWQGGREVPRQWPCPRVDTQGLSVDRNVRIGCIPLQLLASYLLLFHLW